MEPTFPLATDPHPPAPTPIYSFWPCSAQTLNSHSSCCWSGCCPATAPAAWPGHPESRSWRFGCWISSSPPGLPMCPAPQWPRCCWRTGLEERWPWGLSDRLGGGLSWNKTIRATHALWASTKLSSQEPTHCLTAYGFLEVMCGFLLMALNFHCLLQFCHSSFWQIHPCYHCFEMEMLIGRSKAVHLGVGRQL